MISDAEFDRWGEATERGDYGGSKLGVLLKTNGFISPLIAARGCPSSKPNRHKEIHWQKWLFYRQPRRADAEGVEPADHHCRSAHGDARQGDGRHRHQKDSRYRLAAYGDVADRAGGAAVGVTCAGSRLDAGREPLRDLRILRRDRHRDSRHRHDCRPPRLRPTRCADAQAESPSATPSERPSRPRS